MVESKNYWISWNGVGTLPPVRNQGKCGCCAIHACTSMLSSMYSTKYNAKPIMFSIQQILDNLAKMFPIRKQDAQGCYAMTIPEILSYLKAYGLCTECKYPYQGKCRSNPYYDDEFIKQNKCLLTLGDYETNLELQPDERILSLIYTNPIVGGMQVYQSLLDFSGNGIYMGRIGIEEQKGRHAVLIVGYGNENGIKYYEIQNSWGINWANDGLARVCRTLFRDLTAVYDIDCRN